MAQSDAPHGQAKPPALIIAQITDCHVAVAGTMMDQHCQTTERLQQAVKHLNDMDPRPDLVVASGDLVNEGQAAEYTRLQAALAPLEMPIYLLPGNHDDRWLLRNTFADHGYWPAGPFLHYVIDDYPVRLVMLDTQIPGSGAGRLCEARLAWLDATLSAVPAKPTILFMHHPPFATGIRFMDDHGLQGADALAEILRHHAQVEGLFCGHIHRPIQRRFAGTLATVCPSTSHQMALDLEAKDRLIMAFEPPALMLHCWLAETQSLVSHTDFVGEHFRHLPIYENGHWWDQQD